MFSPSLGAIFLSFIIGVALLILGIEIIAVGIKGSRIRLMPIGDFSHKVVVVKNNACMHNLSDLLVIGLKLSPQKEKAYRLSTIMIK
jgi:hypothetical protein